MNHPQAPKKQTQNKANFFKDQNILPKNPATPARQFHNRIGQYYKIRVKHYFLAGLWMQAD